ncbi:MAG: hypothetical protein IPQ07_41675 [Myxococcales bacterium]|nr:hypothetical protein [Myxococcales bacterium]
MKTPVHDYVGVVFCDTRRAHRWRKAFMKRGIEVRVLETFGEESEHGAYKVSVPRRNLVAANQLVTAVTRGEVSLPGSSISPMMAIVAIVVIAATIVAFRV